MQSVSASVLGCAGTAPLRQAQLVPAYGLAQLPPLVIFGHSGGTELEVDSSMAACLHGLAACHHF